VSSAVQMNQPIDGLPLREEAAKGSLPKVAYIMSRFPKLTETFVLYEILQLEELGFTVEIYPLLREHPRVLHPEAERLVQRAHYGPFLSLAVLRAQWRFLRRRPSLYWQTLWAVLRGTFGSANFFFGALAIFPKAVWFAEQVERQGVAHVHAHFANHPTVAAFIVHRLTGIPFSFTAHGSDLHVERRMLKQKVEAAAFVVTVSDYNSKLIVSECGQQARNKVRVIHCGVDSRVFPAPVRLGRRGRPRILCVASFEEVKGHTYLIESCRLLRERGVEFECHLVGEGPLRADVEAQVAEAGLGSQVHLHGGRPRPEVARMMAGADILVLPSVPTRKGKREGIPVVLMEGMASGLPVVASALSGIPELVESDRTGLLVPPRDSVRLADALQRLLRDPKLRLQMGRRGQRKVLRDFNLQTNVAALSKLFLAVSAHTDRPGKCAQLGRVSVAMTCPLKTSPSKM